MPAVPVQALDVRPDEREAVDAGRPGAAVRAPGTARSSSPIASRAAGVDPLGGRRERLGRQAVERSPTTTDGPGRQRDAEPGRPRQVGRGDEGSRRAPGARVDVEPRAGLVEWRTLDRPVSGSATPSAVANRPTGRSGSGAAGRIDETSRRATGGSARCRHVREPIRDGDPEPADRPVDEHVDPVPAGGPGLPAARPAPGRHVQERPAGRDWRRRPRCRPSRARSGCAPDPHVERRVRRREGEPERDDRSVVGSIRDGSLRIAVGRQRVPALERSRRPVPAACRPGAARRSPGSPQASCGRRTGPTCGPGRSRRRLLARMTLGSATDGRGVRPGQVARGDRRRARHRRPRGRRRHAGSAPAHGLRTAATSPIATTTAPTDDRIEPPAPPARA